MLSEESYTIHYGKSITTTQLQVLNYQRANYNKYKGGRKVLVADHNRFDRESVLVRAGAIPIGYLPNKPPAAAEIKREVYRAITNGESTSIKMALVQTMRDGVPKQLELNLHPPVYKAKYEFTIIVRLKPNMGRPDSGSWDPNWYGYITPAGTYTTRDGKSWDFNQFQVSVMKVGNGKVEAVASSARPRYGWDGKYPEHIGGGGRYLAAVTRMLNSRKVRFLELTKDQEPLFKTYKLDAPVIIGVR